MSLWRLLTAGLPVLSLAMAAYIVLRARRLPWIRRLSGNRALSWLCAVLVPVVLVAPFLLINTFTAAVVLLHLFLFWVICDIFSAVIGAVLGKRQGGKAERPYVAGIFAIVICAVYLSVGWYNAHHVSRTEYDISTDKALAGPVRIVCISDTHLGITLDGKSFSKEMEKIQAEEPDLVVVVGDFVDDDSIRADMVSACESLGALETTFGVYFVDGNHDGGYYNSRDFTYAQMMEELEKNGVSVLKDSVADLPCGISIAGRLDRSKKARMSAQSLTLGIDKSRFILMLDHQPNDYAAEEEAGADLVLSGHTHGGHMFPAGQLGLLMKANDRRYGYEKRGGTEFIVTSGMSGWAVPFKTGTSSEYVVINLKPE